jgi:hypothetical protein
MGHLAKVTSIDVIEHFAAALNCFGDDAKTALDGVDMEVRRALHWIQREQKDYWTQRIRRGWDEVSIARKELERKLISCPKDERRSAHDERLALETAKRRLRLAQEKLEAVKRWSHRAEREANEYIGAIQQLRRWMEGELPQAQADLARMARALEDYVALESSAEPSFPDELGALIASQPASAVQTEEASADPPETQATTEEPPSSQPKARPRTENATTSLAPEAQASTAANNETESDQQEQEKGDG